MTRSGFVAIVGRPNVGKSTVMNHLVGQKISITSRKPQTTQHKINGILTVGDYQFVFVDTPGFQTKYVNKLNQLLNQSVIDSLKDVDVVLFVVEAGSFNSADLDVVKLLPKNANVILVVNKQDKLKSRDLMDKFITEISQQFDFKKVLTTCAKHHIGIEQILESIKPYIPESPFYYSEDQLTDRSNRFLAAEIIREQLFRNLGQELPYSLTVEIEKFELQKKVNHISALIVVDKDNQKPMIIGKNGEKLKKIATDARISMENLLDSKVFLEIFVKVRSGFLHDPKFLEQFS